MRVSRCGLFFVILLLGACDDYKRVRPLLDQQEASSATYIELKPFDELEAEASFPSEKAADGAGLQQRVEELRHQADEIKREQGAE